MAPARCRIAVQPPASAGVIDLFDLTPALVEELLEGEGLVCGTQLLQLAGEGAGIGDDALE